MSRASIDKAILTKEQKGCVDFGAGNLLIKGVPGSGKSLVLMKRALKLYKEDESESIYIFTYANSLVKYTKDLFDEKLGEGAIPVNTVDGYCVRIYSELSKKSFYAAKDYQYREIVDKSIQEHRNNHKVKTELYKKDRSFFEDEFKWITEKCIRSIDEYISSGRKGRGSQVRLGDSDKKIVWEMYEIYRNLAVKKGLMTWPDLYIYLIDNLHRIPESFRIDHVLLDEAQDLTIGKLIVIKHLSRKSLTIAADVAQKIYKTSFTWKEAGIDITGRSSKQLTKSFRSTKQIVTLAEDLMKVKRAKESDDLTPMTIPDIDGDIPRLIRFSSMMREENFLIEFVRNLCDSDEVIGVICRTDREITRVKDLLNINKIPYEHIYKPPREEPKWNLLRPGVKIVTAHSSKGLEFDRVIIPYMDDTVYPNKGYRYDKDQLEEYLDMERSLLYVAMTRARESLTMMCVNSAASRFISEFEEGHYLCKEV